jgi:hypothetical protein
MRALVLRLIFGTATLAASVSIAAAQMHKVAKPQQVVRAIGVYEWTGDFAKPTASRLIPVSLYIEGKFEDAGEYIARPVPFALLSGNVYILQTGGVDKGTLDLAYAKHLQAVEPTGDMAFDDGWFGYGSVKPLAAPRKTTTAALKPSKTVPAITTTPDPNRPHFGSKPAGDGGTASSTGSDQGKPDQSKPDNTTASGTKSTSTTDDPNRPTMKRRNPDASASGSDTTTTASTSQTGSTPSDDPNRPTMKRRTPDATTSGSDTNTSNTQTGSTPADDPDRPTMKRRTPDTNASGSDTSASNTQTGSAPADDPDRPTMKRSSGNTTTDTASTTASGDAPADDPDRPTLKRHSAQDARRAGTAAAGIGGGGSVDSLNDDPNRPNLHHGKPASSMTEEDLPKLTGIPTNLHQMVAVSDAVNRDPHIFTLEWEDEAQHQAILQKMQTLARAQLAAYGTTTAAATPTPASPAKKTTPAPTRPHRATAPAPPPSPLFDEQLKAYTLSYGGDPTYVYSANTGGTGAALRYVTIVAQADSLGEIKPAIQSVTDAAHLYRTPKMQFVDVVDAEASNRASLLFELRSQNARQFALYRVIAAHPEQIFLTGTTQ